MTRLLRPIRILVARLRGFPGICEDCREPTYRSDRARLCLTCKAKRREASSLRWRQSEHGREVRRRASQRFNRKNPKRRAEITKRSWRKHRETRLATQRERRARTRTAGEG